MIPILVSNKTYLMECEIMTKKYYQMDDFEEPDYDSFDLLIEFKFIGDKSNYIKSNETYSKQAKIIIDRLQPDGICHGGGIMALYFNKSTTSTSVLKYGYLNSYWEQRTPDFKLLNYSDFENNIYINSFDKPYAAIVN